MKPNTINEDIERILRENITHRELQEFPEATDFMVLELTKLFVAWRDKEVKQALDIESES